MAHSWMSHVTQINKSWHTHEWVMIMTIRGGFWDVSLDAHMRMCDMTHSCAWHDPFMCVTWPICVLWLLYTCDMTHLSHIWVMSHTCMSRRAFWRTSAPSFIWQTSFIWHDSFICVTWLIHMCAMTHLYVKRKSLQSEHVIWASNLHESRLCICVTWLIHLCTMSHSCVPWLIDLCDMAHLNVCHDSFKCVPWFIHMCAMTHSYVWHDSFKCVPWLIHVCDTSIDMCAMTDSLCDKFVIHWCSWKSDLNESRLTYEWV